MMPNQEPRPDIPLYELASELMMFAVGDPDSFRRRRLQEIAGQLMAIARELGE